MNLARGLRALPLLPILACAGLPAPAKPTGATPSAPAPRPHVTVRLALSVDGRPAGQETWEVSDGQGGRRVYEFESNVDTPRGRITGKGQYTVDAGGLPDAAEVLVTPPQGDPMAFELTRSGGDLSMSLHGESRSDVLKAGRPSNVFVPRPFFVGMAPVCALLAGSTPPPLVEFPGSAITVLDKKTVDGATVYSLDHGGLGRTLLACDAAELVAVLDPWTGQAAVREGREALGKTLALSLERKKPPTPPELTEQEVTVSVPAEGGDEPATLACSLLLPPSPPSGKSPKLPGVVFVSGSGPQDRDEDSPGRGGLKLAIFKVIAVALAEKQIASLRCDDRGTGKSTGTFEKATLATFTRDAGRMLAALGERPEIDAGRLGLIGHSEGAVVGPAVALKGKLHALVLMAAPGRPLPEIGMMQEEALLKESGLPPDQIQRQLEAQKSVLEAVRTGKPLPDEVRSPQKEIVEKQRAWLKSHFDHDVLGTLGKVPKMQVFVAQGGKDVQVPKEDAELVKKALAEGKNPGVRLTLYPDLNHVFATSHGGGVTEYSDPDARIDPAFLSDAVSFLASALAK